MKHEAALGVLMFVELLIKIRSDEKIVPAGIMHFLLLLNALLFFIPAESGNLFGQMFYFSSVTHFQKSVLALGLLIVSLISDNWLKQCESTMEFYLLLFASVLGMNLMISSGNLLMFYVGLETSTIPLAAAANFDVTRRTASEAAMKLILSSAFSSALMLMGISFLYGTSGSIDYAVLAAMPLDAALAQFGFVLFFAGFAFKISAVPFHLWTADVYQGSPVAVTAFLSVLSKAAVIFVFVSVLYRVFGAASGLWYTMVILLAVLSIVVGNLFAMRQDNIKRFLAFSSIAQVGYLLVGISGISQGGQNAVFYFLLVYLFSNLGAFGVVSVISSVHGKENISDYKGFYQTNKMLAWVLTIALFSLAGVPPTAGFFGKFFLLMSGAARGNYILIIIASLNMVISFYYYLRIVRVMFMDSNAYPIESTTTSTITKAALWFCVAGMLIAGLYGPVYEYIAHL